MSSKAACPENKVFGWKSLNQKLELKMVTLQNVEKCNRVENMCNDEHISSSPTMWMIVDISHSMQTIIGYQYVLKKIQL